MMFIQRELRQIEIERGRWRERESMEVKVGSCRTTFIVALPLVYSTKILMLYEKNIFQIKILKLGYRTYCPASQPAMLLPPPWHLFASTTIHRFVQLRFNFLYLVAKVTRSSLNGKFNCMNLNSTFVFNLHITSRLRACMHFDT